MLMKLVEREIPMARVSRHPQRPEMPGRPHGSGLAGILPLGWAKTRTIAAQGEVPGAIVRLRRKGRGRVGARKSCLQRLDCGKWEKIPADRRNGEIEKMSAAKVVMVIPARYGSVRLPGKPLVMLAGKTMIQRVYEQ